MMALDVPVADRRYRRALRRVKRAEERLVRAQARLGVALEDMRWSHRVHYLRTRAIESMVANDGADEF